MNLISNKKGVYRTRYLFYGDQLIGIFPCDTPEQQKEFSKHRIIEDICFSETTIGNFWTTTNLNGSTQALTLSMFPNELRPLILLLDLPLPHNFPVPPLR